MLLEDRTEKSIDSLNLENSTFCEVCFRWPPIQESLIIISII
jgi:hypothetical protein